MSFTSGVLHGILRRKPATIRTIRKKLEKQDRKVVRQTTGDYIKDYRKKIQWEWFTEVNTAHFFEYCLLKANWKPGKFKGIEIPRGSFIASLNTISTECGLSIQQIRTAIKHLESTQELTRNQHGKYTVFTVNNYCMYQDSNTISNTEVTQSQHEDNTMLTRNQQESNTEVTTIEERKNNKEREEREKSKKGKNEEKKSKKEKADDIPQPPYFPNDEKLDNAFREYVEFRKRIKKPLLTKTGFTRAFNDLEKASTVNGVMDNDLAVKVIEQSIFKCYVGLFPVKDNQNNNYQQAGKTNKQGIDFDALREKYKGE